jgi:hypothetical protein
MHEPFPVEFPPGLFETSTKAGMAGKWHDGHLVRWVKGRIRPVLGWERIAFLNGATIASPIRAMHFWVDNNGFERVGILCEKHLYVLEGDNLINISPTPAIAGPEDPIAPGGYGTYLYDKNVYGTPRPTRPSRLRVGNVWRLENWGQNLLAMASTDGRLLQWVPGTPAAIIVPNAPTECRTFLVTPERHVMVFGMKEAGKQHKHASFGWCSQENIEDWDFSSTTNTAGKYDVMPASRILYAEKVRDGIIFWTVQGAFAVNYRGLPYMYSYAYLGAYLGPLSGCAAAVYPGICIWPAADGFWEFNGSAIRQVNCPILDWFQQTYDFEMTRAYMTGFFNGNASEVWWSFPSEKYDAFGVKLAPNPHNDFTMIYNFEEGWWSKAQIGRTAGCPGTMVYHPFMANGTTVYRHEKGDYYAAEDIGPDPHGPDPTSKDRRNLPWVRSGAINVATGNVMATTKQLWVDTDAPLNAVGYELFASKGRTASPPRSKGLKFPREPGKIDYRITGRDFFLKLQAMTDGVTWTHGQSHILMSPRARSGWDNKAGATRAPTGP